MHSCLYNYCDYCDYCNYYDYCEVQVLKKYIYIYSIVV